MTNQNDDIASDQKQWVILVVNLISPRPNQVRYQRVLALAARFNLIVVTEHPLPDDLVPLVYDVHKVTKGFKKWICVVGIARQLAKQGRRFYVHTQYSPDPLIAGYLCKAICGSKWVYDIWDHPSLGWSIAHGLGRYAKQAIWMLLLRRLIVRADAWVIAMHPGVLAHLPPAPVSCRLIFMRPGYANTWNVGAPKDTDVSRDAMVRIAFAGQLAAARGLSLISDWARNYTGPPAYLDLIGACDRGAESSLQKLQTDLQHGSQLRLKIWGELPHRNAIDILRKADIGLCPVDPAVLNYRYAYPVKVVEYMSLGLVVVATEGHGVDALVREADTGFIGKYAASDFGAAINRAIGVCMDAEARQVLIQSAQRVVAECGWDEINQQLGKHLMHVVAR